MARTSSLAAQAAPRCTRCGSERIVKNGKNACGHQQFRCRACGACRVLAPKSRQANPAAPRRSPARGGPRAAEPAGGGARLWRGPQHAHRLAQKKAEGPPAPERDAACPPRRATCSNSTSFGASSAPKPTCAGYGLPSAARPARSSLALSGDRSAESARALRGRIPARLPLPRHAQRLLAGLRASVFPGALTGCAAKPKARPTTPNASSAPCASAWAASCARPLSFSKCERMHELALRLFVHEYNQQSVI